jgi:hypothetical protein
VIRSALLVLLASSTAFAAPKKGPRKQPPKEEPPPPPKEPEPPPPPPAPPPRTANQRIVGVLDVRVEGVPPEIAAQFQQQLEVQLDTKHFWLAPRSRMHEMMANSTKWTEGCVIGSCLAEVRRQTQAELVLLAALTGSGTSFGYVVTLVRTDTGAVLEQKSERCDVCTVSEALANATLATVQLLNNVPDKLPDAHHDEQVRLAQVQAKADTEVAAARHHPHAVATGVLITGLAVAAGGAGVYFANKDAGVAMAAAGGGLALGGIIALTF